MAEMGRPRAEAASAAMIGALRDVKARAYADGERTDEASGGKSRPVVYDATGSREPDSIADAINAGEMDRPVEGRPRPVHPPPAASERDYAGRLLRAKRRASGRDDQGGAE